MGPLTYSLCNSAIGVVMWITGGCAFPPLITPKEISLAAPGLLLSQEFRAPVDKSYMLYLVFVFPNEEAREKDVLVGTDFTESCFGETPYERIPEKEKKGLGLPVPIRVLVKNRINGSLVFQQDFNSLCYFGHAGNTKSRMIGWIPLSKGSYRLEVYNLASQPAFDGLQVRTGLVSGGKK